jgi:hypothetical protein
VCIETNTEYAAMKNLTTFYDKSDRNSAIMNIHPIPVISASSIYAQRLGALKKHLQETCKVCPKPWYWGRFFTQFQPLYESYWLMQWWNTTDEEKYGRFITQLDYLACHTNRFQNAYWYLMTIGDSNWHYRKS